MSSIHLSGSLPAVHSVGISIWDPIFSQQKHIGPCWEVVHIVRGIVKLHMSGNVFRGKSGDTLLVPAQTPHRDEFPLGTDFEVLHIMFKWNDASVLFPYHINQDLARLPLVEKQSIREMVFETYDSFKRQHILCQEITNAGLYRLLLFMCSVTRELHSPGPKSKTVATREYHRILIRKAKEFIRENIKKPITLFDIAAHLGISAYHLSHLFSEESGFTLCAYVVSLRMEQAAQLLADPGKRVSEVAYAVGFENPNYFCRAFRRHFGCSPGKYRARVFCSRRPAKKLP